jgi:hypothetical protein
VSFLFRHAQKLDFLRLLDVDLGVTGDGDWSSAFTRLAGKLRGLREIQLRGTFWQMHSLGRQSSVLLFLGDITNARRLA